MDLTFIENLISPIYPHFKSAYDSISASDIPIVNSINRHLKSKDGKQIRPMLTLLSALCCGLPDDIPQDHPIFKIAAAIETLHCSTLIHDDVIDESDTRRGIATINSLWNNKTAVLAGDFYLAQVMRTINEVNDQRITHLINLTVIKMCEGELLQLQQTNHLYGDKSTYFQIIQRKTAIFLAACCEAGAIFASADSKTLNDAHTFGLNLGMAFQIRDDILDYYPTAVTGKPQGNDLREHKCTLPLIITLQNAPDDIKKNIMSLLEHDVITDSAVETISAYVNAYGIESAAETLELYIDTAMQSLNNLPDNKFRSALQSLSLKLKEK